MAFWGLFGGFAVEGLDFFNSWRRHHRPPWKVGGPRQARARAYLIAESIRLLIGAGLALAAARSGTNLNALAAVGIGAGAPVFLEKLTLVIPLTADNGVRGQAATAPADREIRLDRTRRGRVVLPDQSPSRDRLL